jgi:hypothetical protein
MNDLTALLGGGAAAPLPAGDPLAAALGGAAPAGVGAPPLAPAPSPYPSADPMVVGSMLEQLLMAQQADHAALQQQQTMAIVANPLFEALVSGAPLTPGAGQDAQAIAPTGDVLPPMGL